MTDEIVKPKEQLPEIQEEKITIEPDKLFKIQVVSDGGTIRDEFQGVGQDTYDETLAFAQNICRIYRGSKIFVLLKTKHV